MVTQNQRWSKIKVNELSLICLMCCLHRGCSLQVVCEHLGQAVSEDQISVDMMQQKAVISELFSSVCAEIRDEVGNYSNIMSVNKA